MIAREGFSLPNLEHQITLADMIAYAGATWDWHRLHYDLQYLQESGLEAPVVDGQMLGAYLAKQVIDWLGPRARVRAMSFRFREMVFAGETIQVAGEVIGVAEESRIARIEISQRIVTTSQRVIIDQAACTVDVSA